MRRTVLAALLVPLLAAVLAGAGATPPAEAQSAPADVVVTGRGWGHGRGLGQFGAYGYAKDHGWDWRAITSHFYGGTVEGTAANTELDVLLKAYRNDSTCAGTPSGCWTIVLVESGILLVEGATGLVGPAPGRPHAVAVQWTGGDTWNVYEGDSCSGMGAEAFTLRGTMTADQVVVRLANPNPATRVELLAVCEVGRHRYLRGSVVADAFSHANDTAVRQRTMNRVPVESYLRSVVPAESPSSWGGTNGSAPGQHALHAQAVAARSYVLAGDTRYRPADTCDDIFCQVYRGFGTNTAGTVELFETTNGDLAVAQTAGVVRRFSAGVARTEFSSSTGGYTAGGTFPAVPDDGDDVTANPNHTWTARLPVSGIEAILDARAGRDLGAFGRFVILERNGLGEDGGRVRSVRAEFAGGNVTLTGDTFRSLFQRYGVKSDWFVVPEGQSGGGFTDTAGSVHAANIDKVAAAGITTGCAPDRYCPGDPVTRAQMATFVTKGYELAPAPSPFSDTAGDTHEAGIGAVAAAGITQGCTAEQYCPTANITRGQMAVFLARAEGLDPVEGEGGLCDVDGHPYEGFIRAIVAAGIAGGGTDGCFRPDDPVNREQMATFLAQALGL